jgi:hypothetical protein
MTALSNPKSEVTTPFDPNQALNTMQTTLDKFLNAASVEAVYGPAVSQGENMVIPAGRGFEYRGFWSGLRRRFSRCC